MPIFPDNFVANSLSGTILITDGHANLSLTTNPYALEGDKSFIIKLRKGGPSGLVIATSSPITLRDTSSIVSFTANISSVNEGNLVQFTLVTANAVDNSNVYYSVFPATANITRQDFFGANTGMATIVSNQATFALRANADLSLMDETGENFRVQLRTNSPVGNIIYSTSNVQILDVSKGFNILSFVENNSTVAEGGTLTLTFNATNIPVGTVFHYFTEGNATTSTFTGGNTGSFVMNGLSNTVTLLPTAVPYSTTQNFNVKLRALSNTGAVVATSNNIIAIDSALAYMTATGGIIEDSNGYRIHTFTTSGNLTISSLGAGTGILTEYLIVAGGGAGGGNYGPGPEAPYAYGGGGGAGGLLTGNISAEQKTYTITVGAGGSKLAAPVANGRGGNGNNSNIFAPGFSTIIAIGGGGGGAGPIPSGGSTGNPGGSGGGNGWYTAVPTAAGTGTPGQGNPGGKSPAVATYAGGGGGAGTAGFHRVNPPGSTSGYGGNGLPISWVTPGYGTPGPAPGRWFAGGGGGDNSQSASPFGVGGPGGGANGGGAPASFPLAAGVTNTGGGGGGGSGIPATSSGSSGGSGIVIVRYPYVPPPTISNVLTTATAFSVGSNITFTINATNANLTTLYYTTDGNVIASNFINGNTGSFVANASGGIVTLQANTNIPLDESRQFRLQIRQDSTSGFVSGSSANVTIDGYGLQISATGGTITTSGGYRTHTFINSATLTVTKIPQVQENVEILMVAGGGGPGGSFPGNATAGGGGGGGGVLYRANATLALQSYPIVIGGGGGMTGGGTPTTGFSVISSGGGAGGNNGNYAPPRAGFSGGNGGGGGQPGGSGGPSNQNSYGGWFKYGNDGNPQTGDQAGGPGGSADATFSISGAPVTYAAGGQSTRYTPAPAVAPGTGNGGWGSRGDSPGYLTQISNGAPGIVIIRYPYI
jgi:hypothetical protein